MFVTVDLQTAFSPKICTQTLGLPLQQISGASSKGTLVMIIQTESYRKLLYKYLLTYLLTPWIRVLLEKPTGF
jgi:hypothetical protein